MSYSGIQIHLVFCVKYRRALIGDEWRDRLHQYMIAIIERRKHRVLAINSVEDHIHILIGYNLNDLVPDLMRELKGGSSAWVNNNGFAAVRFAWQDGYAAFSVDAFGISPVCGYIAGQREHHKKVRYRDEIIGILNAAGIEWKPEYLFTTPEE
jgi:putative transposase